MSSAPRARAFALSSSSQAKTYVGRSVSRLVGTTRATGAGSGAFWERSGAVLVIVESAAWVVGTTPEGQISGLVVMNVTPSERSESRNLSPRTEIPRLRRLAAPLGMTTKRRGSARNDTIRE